MEGVPVQDGPYHDETLSQVLAQQALSRLVRGVVEELRIESEVVRQPEDVRVVLVVLDNVSQTTTYHKPQHITVVLKAPIGQNLLDF